MCNVCHGSPGAGWLRCYSCKQTIEQVSDPIKLVVPISLATKDGQFYHVLKSYKNPWGKDNQLLQMAALLARFIAKHRACIRDKAKADWNVITIVPSSGDRAGRHPLESAISRVPLLREEFEGLLRKGTAELRHNHADDEGYEVTAAVEGRRVLLVDDTFTTGSRVQSAASALQRAGAQVIAAVVAARIMNPSFNEETRTLWERQRAKQFDFDTCCLCADS